MKYVVCYDVQETKIRNQVIKCLQSYAYRIQYSVFIGDGTLKEIREMQKKLEYIVADSEKPRLLVLILSEECVQKSWFYGMPLEEKKNFVMA